MKRIFAKSLLYVIITSKILQRISATKFRSSPLNCLNKNEIFEKFNYVRAKMDRNKFFSSKKDKI